MIRLICLMSALGGGGMHCFSLPPVKGGFPCQTLCLCVCVAKTQSPLAPVGRNAQWWSSTRSTELYKGRITLCQSGTPELVGCLFPLAASKKRWQFPFRSECEKKSWGLTTSCLALLQQGSTLHMAAFCHTFCFSCPPPPWDILPGWPDFQTYPLLWV